MPKIFTELHFSLKRQFLVGGHLKRTDEGNGVSLLIFFIYMSSPTYIIQSSTIYASITALFRNMRLILEEIFQ